MRRVVVSVINDLSTDQRVHKVCCTLQKLGYTVILIGREQRNSLPLEKRNYATKRMILIFERGPLFYMEYQVRLFLWLLFKKTDVLLSNDLDTLLPNYLISKIKRQPLVYDSHELFCEVPELQNKPVKKRIWKKLERAIFPKLKYVFTVNDSIAELYNKEYGVPVTVVRNVPVKHNQNINRELNKNELGIPDDKKIIVLQGAGINIDRGSEEAVKAMYYIDSAVLLIIGSGDVITILKQLTMDLKLQHKVQFIDKLPFEKLGNYTRLADIGLTLDKNTNVNYKYSLPNKLFDYIHAEVPVLASDLTEVKKIIEKYGVGTCIENHSPKHIADKLNSILNDEKMLATWKTNTIKASSELNWENEEKKLIPVFEQFLN